jgi:hypothetical protein
VPRRPRGRTVNEAYHQQPPEELVALAEAWLPDASRIIVDAIWSGYVKLTQDARLVSSVQMATDDLERGITQRLEIAIRDGLTGDEPFDVQHGVPEGESRRPAPARPPEYDIAFIHFGNWRVMWPLEAKVMPPDRPLSEYVAAVNERYLTCQYAPFCGEGGMVGYALKDAADELFTSIEEALGTALATANPATARSHRMSRHIRDVPIGKPYPRNFLLHHMIMQFRSNIT